MKRHLFVRILLSLLGTAFILWGAAHLLLAFCGVPATATITSIRRVGGERAEATPGHYTYSISYTFLLPNGQPVDGVTTQIGDAIFLKATGAGIVTVRYLKPLPAVNVLEEDAFSAGPLILLLTGGLLIFFSNRRQAPQRGTPKK